jgi:hypothetical protein
MAIQNRNGRAFEYAMIKSLQQYVSKFGECEIKRDALFYNTENDFKSLNKIDKKSYMSAGKTASKFLTKVEPRLISKNGCALNLIIQSDKSGEVGDVRDIICIKMKPKWEIGISAKHNHLAVKHSRLSEKIDFCKKWMGVECSDEYFKGIANIYCNLRKYAAINKNWKDVAEKEDMYFEQLSAFQNEISQKLLNGKNVTSLFEYLLGKRDFYKIIFKGRSIIIQGLNMYGTLNRPNGSEKPHYKVPLVKFPKKFISSTTKGKNTLNMIFDKGWQISFRLHNASTRVEPSFKFDIQIIGLPQNIFVHYLEIKANG